MSAKNFYRVLILVLLFSGLLTIFGFIISQPYVAGVGGLIMLSFSIFALKRFEDM